MVLVNGSPLSNLKYCLSTVNIFHKLPVVFDINGTSRYRQTDIETNRHHLFFIIVKMDLGYVDKGY